jgi:purine-cytosine permease-like protein
VFRILFWVSLPLFSLLSVAVLAGRAGGHPAPSGGFNAVAFITQLASAVSFNVTAAPYVSDYSRYLPTKTPRAAIIINVFLGSALSAIWLIALGAWLATHMGVTDALLALKQSGDAVALGFGSVLTLTTTVDSIRQLEPSPALRIAFIAAITLSWLALALSFGGDAITYVNAMLVMMLYFLMPWTAVNLIDYFWLRRGRYSIGDLFTPHGLYGAWGGRGLFAYAIGFLASVPFFVVPNVYTGPIAASIGGVDIGWLVSLAAASLAYHVVSWKFDPAAELAAVAGMTLSGSQPQGANTARMSAENS